MTMHELAKALMGICKETQKTFYHYTHQVLLLYYYSCNKFQHYNNKFQGKWNTKKDFHQTILLVVLDNVLRNRLQSQTIAEQYAILYRSCLITAFIKITSMMEVGTSSFPQFFTKDHTCLFTFGSFTTSILS